MLSMHRLPQHVSTILFDVGNTLHHLDYVFIAAAISRHSHAASAHEISVAEYTAKAAVDALFRTRSAGTDGDRRFSYFGVILEELGVPPAPRAAIIAKLDAENV